MIIKLLVDAGDMKPGPALGQKIGPLGIPIGKVIEAVNAATASFKGMKVPVVLDIDTKTKQFKVNVLSPTVSELLKKEAGIEKASGAANKIKVGNLAIEQVIAIAKTKQPDMLARSFLAALKSVLGSCVSLGILVENKPAKDILAEIEQGAYKEEIEKQITTPSAEKLSSLAAYFAEVKAAQEELLKKEAEAAAAKEAEAAKEAAAPAEAEKAEAEKEGEKKEAKKEKGEKSEEKKK